MKVMAMSVFDYAGSLYRIVEAINLNTYNHVNYAVMFPVDYVSQFKRYPPIYKMTSNDEAIITSDDIERMNLLLDDCDLVHLKTDYSAIHSTFSRFNINKPIIQTVCGSSFRNMEQDKIEEYKKLTTFRTALNPDLNIPEWDGIYTPFAYDTIKFDNVWKENKKITIAHSPSTRKKKGTEIFLSACKKLNIDVILIENEKHNECLNMRSKATIFFDQANCGSYGNSAVEAMAMGIPTMAYISDSSYKQSNGKLDNCPVINCGNTEESISKAIENALSLNLKKLSKETKRWCDEQHSYKSIGTMWDKIYKEIV
jgi:hypothetical protein